jgi:hypothetical protein
MVTAIDPVFSSRRMILAIADRASVGWRVLVHVTSVASVSDAVAQMQEIGAALPPGDGVAAFNGMYLAVTQAVEKAIADSYFASSEFLTRLDVVFANRYFLALGNALNEAPMPRCWKALWDVRASEHRAPLQFALAGMNAHINHDLVLAVVDTLRELGGHPETGDYRSDFVRVNTLLASLEEGIRRSFETGFLARLDQRFAAMDALQARMANWSIARARAVAWNDARRLWAVAHHPRLAHDLEQLLDHTVAAASDCLLLPIEHHHHHLPGDDLCTQQAPALPAQTQPA